MKKTLVTACVAALMFPACSREPAEAPVASEVRARTPVQSPPRTLPAMSSEKIAVVADAGLSEEVPEVVVDVLSLPHEHRGRDNHLERARGLREEGDLPGALSEARRALADAPGDPDTLSVVAVLSRKARQRELAVEAYSRLARLQPEDATPVIQQARMLLEMGRSEEAVTVAQEAIARDATNPEAFHVLGRAHLVRNELASAIERFDQVLALAPTHGYALNNLGFACLRANENQRALEVLRKAAEQLPHVAWVQNNLGIALQRQGFAEEAREAFALATSLSPKYVKARINLDRVALVQPSEEAAEEVSPQ